MRKKASRSKNRKSSKDKEANQKEILEKGIKKRRSSIQNRKHKSPKPDPKLDKIPSEKRKKSKSREKAEASRDKPQNNRLKTASSPKSTMKIKIPVSPPKETANWKPDAHRSSGSRILVDHKQSERGAGSKDHKKSSVGSNLNHLNDGSLRGSLVDIGSETNKRNPKSIKHKPKTKRIVATAGQVDIENVQQIRKKVFRDFKSKLMGGGAGKSEEKKQRKKSHFLNSNHNSQKSKNLNLDFLVKHLRKPTERQSQSDGSMINARTADESQKVTLRMNQQKHAGKFFKKKPTTTKKKSTMPANIAITKKTGPNNVFPNIPIHRVDMVNEIKHSESTARQEQKDQGTGKKSPSSASFEIIKKEEAAIEIQRQWKGFMSRTLLNKYKREFSHPNSERKENSPSEQKKAENRVVFIPPNIEVMSMSDVVRMESDGREEELSNQKNSLRKLNDKYRMVVERSLETESRRGSSNCDNLMGRREVTIDKYQKFAEEQLENLRKINELVEKIDKGGKMDPANMIAEIHKLKKETETNLVKAEKRLNDLNENAAPFVMRKSSMYFKKEPLKSSSQDNKTNPNLKAELIKKREDIEKGFSDMEKRSRVGSVKEHQKSRPLSLRSRGSNPNMRVNNKIDDDWVSPDENQIEVQKAAIVKTIFSDNHDRSPSNKWNDFKLNSLVNSLDNMQSSTGNNYNPLSSPKTRNNSHREDLGTKQKETANKEYPQNRNQGYNHPYQTQFSMHDNNRDNEAILISDEVIENHKTGKDLIARLIGTHGASLSERSQQEARTTGLSLQLKRLDERIAQQFGEGSDEYDRESLDREMGQSFEMEKRVEEASVIPVDNEEPISPTGSVSQKWAELSEKMHRMSPGFSQNKGKLTIEVEQEDSLYSALDPTSIPQATISSTSELNLKSIGSPKEVGKRILRELNSKATEKSTEIITSEVLNYLFDELLNDGFILRELFKLQVESPVGIKTNIRAVKKYLSGVCEYIKGKLSSNRHV